MKGIVPKVSGERLFLAVAIPAGVQPAIDAGLPTPLPGRPVPAAARHLTVRFLGTTDAPRRDRLLDGLAEAACAGLLGLPFSLRLDRLGAFPSLRRARVLWLGTCAGEGEAAFARLVVAVERVVQSVGYAPAVRAQLAHVTLSRINPPRSVGDLIARHAVTAEELAVHEVTVFGSDLSAGGPHYRVLATIPLRPGD